MAYVVPCLSASVGREYQMESSTTCKPIVPASGAYTPLEREINI